jgi:hypothetical protein
MTSINKHHIKLDESNDRSLSVCHLVAIFSRHRRHIDEKQIKTAEILSHGAVSAQAVLCGITNECI